MQMNKIHPLVSIIIITFNQQDYIEQCIRSVLSQETEYPFEIVVSDDHSNDKTPTLIEQLVNYHPDIIYFNSNKQNLGIVKNYLTALSQCRGKYLCLLGGDDYWVDKLKIQNQVKFLEANLDYGLVYSDYSILDDRTGNIREWVLRKSGKAIIDGNATQIMCQGDSQIMPLTVCLRLNLLNNDYKNIMNDNYFVAEDFPTWFWVSYHSKIHFDPILTAIYRIHIKSFTNSQSNIQRWNFARSHIYMRKKIMKHLNYKPLNWEKINTTILRGIMKLSLKTRIGQKYGILSYKLIENKNFEDFLTFIGLKCESISFLLRALLYFLKRIKIIKPNKII